MQEREIRVARAKMRERSKEGVVQTLTCEVLLENVLHFFGPLRLYVFSDQRNIFGLTTILRSSKHAKKKKTFSIKYFTSKETGP